MSSPRKYTHVLRPSPYKERLLQNSGDGLQFGVGSQDWPKLREGA